MIIKNEQKSFTLIELLVVIVIIGILAGVIMISTSSSIDKANIAKVKVFEESIKNNMLMNLISEWSLNEVVGNLTPDSWGDRTATMGIDTASPTSLNDSHCVSGKCMNFDGGDYIITNLKFTTTSIKNNGLTYAFWIKTSTSAAQCIISQDTHSGCTYSCASGVYIFSGKASATIYDGSTYRHINTLSNINDNKWHYIVATFGKTLNIDIYFDGKKENEAILTNFYNYSPINGMTIGYLKENTRNDHFLNGSLDELKIYDSLLSISVVKQNYIAGLDSLLSSGNMSKEDYNERINVLAHE